MNWRRKSRRVTGDRKKKSNGKGKTSVDRTIIIKTYNASLHTKQLRGEVLIRLSGQTRCRKESVEATTKSTRRDYGATEHVRLRGDDE